MRRAWGQCLASPRAVSDLGSLILLCELAESGFTSAVWLESLLWVVTLGDALNLFFQDKLQGKSDRQLLRESWRRD